ncbi:carboxypeptidase regulatory-like domain-containing protein [Candidatus Saccharibacteria bacterium]|nr:carboxypeptidase regulatory-like domain-containing protein [Candidatus Saccharibacteria bacterium]
MGKKQTPDERKPDLAVPDQDVLEERVKAMLDIEESPGDQTQELKNSDKTKPVEETKLPELDNEKDNVSSAPELPTNHETKEMEKEEEEIEPEEPKEEKVINLDEAPTDQAIIDTDDKEEEKELPDEESSDKSENAEEKIGDKSGIDDVIEDKKTAEAVEDIVAKEADELLEVEDEKSIEKEKKQKTTIGSKIKNFFKAWWNNPKARWISIIFLLAFILATVFVPNTRYFLLNSIGFRGSASITVIDESTNQPLKNVEVTIANVSSFTDTNGNAVLSKVKLGSNNLVVKKRAFAESSQKVTIKLGSNSLSDVSLTPTGEQYTFVVSDFLSGKPIVKAEAVSGDASAVSDENGLIKITIDDVQDTENVEVVINKEEFREEKVLVNADDKSGQQVHMVPSRKHMFISKRSGRYDLYSIDVDGKNEKVIFEGTGNERDDVILSIHPRTSVAAEVSTRNNKTNQDGFKLSTLNVINAQTGDIKEVAESERIQIIDWVGDNLIFVQTVSGTSAADPNRSKLQAYNYKSKEIKEIASTNYFNDVIVAAEKIYYAPSSTYKPEDAKLFRVNADGTQKTTVANQEVWNMFRSDYENLVLSANQTWLNLRIGEDSTTSISSPPSNPKSRTYADNKDGKNSIWVDNRDGKGVLLNYENSSRNEQTLKSESGLKNPIYWLNNRTIVYRISGPQETADYLVSLDGGDALKITDVTDTNSIENWYYY